MRHHPPGEQLPLGGDHGNQCSLSLRAEAQLQHVCLMQWPCPNFPEHPPTLPLHLAEFPHAQHHPASAIYIGSEVPHSMIYELVI